MEKDRAAHTTSYSGGCTQKNASAVRSGDQKVILTRVKPTVRLTNLAADIAETNNLAADRLDDVSSLQAEVDDWAQELKGPASLDWGAGNYPPLPPVQKRRQIPRLFLEH
jgi:hypothetical protein